MTSYLAPESPEPSTVTSEYYFREFNGYPMINNERKRCLFGEEYEQEFGFCLSKHSEANCDDRVCLIGEESEWIVPIQQRLFLNKPIHFIDCRLQSNKIEERLSTKKFERIILLNCLHKINSLFIAPINLLRNSLTNDGRLIIIYREPVMNTLPFPMTIQRKWFDLHMNHTQFIQQLHLHQRYNIDIRQKSETIKFSMSKIQWFSLLNHQMFYPLTLIDRTQMIDGLRQLNETFFKYTQGLIEMHERLTFVTVQKGADMFLRASRSTQPSNNLMRPIEQKPLANRIWHSQISITDEINQLMYLNKHNQKSK